jgi:hypothetical protein
MPTGPSAHADESTFAHRTISRATAIGRLGCCEGDLRNVWALVQPDGPDHGGMVGGALVVGGGSSMVYSAVALRPLLSPFAVKSERSPRHG